MDNITDNKYHQMALNKVRALMKLKPAKDSEQGQELEMLISLIEAYEEVHVPMQASDPIAYLQYRMEQQNLKQSDLKGVITQIRLDPTNALNSNMEIDYIRIE